MKITKRKIKDLIRAEYNPRKITPVEEFDLKESLMRFGLDEPIIININNFQSIFIYQKFIIIFILIPLQFQVKHHLIFI